MSWCFTRRIMFEQSDDREEEAAELSESIVEAVEKDQSKATDEDTLSRREKKIESTKEQERIQKARALKKQLRKRELGILRYRWPAAVLIITGMFSIITQFLPVWVQDELEPAYGFNTYMEGFFFNGNVFFLFPVISGIILIAIGFFAYTRPKATYWAVAPAMMMAMAGSFVYLLIEVALSVPGVEVVISATGTPLQMLVTVILSLLAIALREKE